MSVRRKRLNATRRQGALFFRRETCRLHDGTPWGETLWVKVKRPHGLEGHRVVCAHIGREFPSGKNGGLELGLGVYLPAGRVETPVAVAHAMREALKRAR